MEQRDDDNVTSTTVVLVFKSNVKGLTGLFIRSATAGHSYEYLLCTTIASTSTRRTREFDTPLESSAQELF